MPAKPMIAKYAYRSAMITNLDSGMTCSAIAIWMAKNANPAVKGFKLTRLFLKEINKFAEMDG